MLQSLPPMNSPSNPYKINKIVTKLSAATAVRHGSHCSKITAPISVMAAGSATAFLNKAPTCRSLMRHVTDERTLCVAEMIAENVAKVQALEMLATHDAPPLQPQ